MHAGGVRQSNPIPAPAVEEARLWSAAWAEVTGDHAAHYEFVREQGLVAHAAKARALRAGRAH